MKSVVLTTAGVRAVRGRTVRLLTALCVAASVAGAVRAQQESQRQVAESPANTTRMIDAYGRVGHCDESARLDLFAVEL
jgi:predicted house-cleaning NTP pyrophosphatase (Maf/HAM1 superfamily)